MRGLKFVLAGIGFILCSIALAGVIYCMGGCDYGEYYTILTCQILSLVTPVIGVILMIVGLCFKDKKNGIT